MWFFAQELHSVNSNNRSVAKEFLIWTWEEKFSVRKFRYQNNNWSNKMPKKCLCVCVGTTCGCFITCRYLCNLWNHDASYWCIDQILSQNTLVAWIDRYHDHRKLWTCCIRRIDLQIYNRRWFHRLFVNKQISGCCQDICKRYYWHIKWPQMNYFMLITH